MSGPAVDPRLRRSREVRLGGAVSLPPTTPGVSFNHIVYTAAYTLSASVCSVCVQVNELQAEAESVLRNALSLSMKKEMFIAFGDLW